MPRHSTPFLKSCFGEYERETWLPVSGDTPTITRFGGPTALLKEGEEWPMHAEGDKQPMSLVFQADTDILPAPMQEEFGGAGKIFQLFIPLGDDASGEPRMWMSAGEEDEIVHCFDVRILSKGDALHEVTCPAGVDIEIPEVSPRFVASWERRVDYPFDHGGPYKGNLEEVHEKFEEACNKLIDELGYEDAKERIYHADDQDEALDIEESANEWGTKIGGWPSLEQGPQKIDETLPHLLQISGDDEIGEEVAFDGHGWLCRAQDGNWVWYDVTS